ncbi:MAG: epoxyqueuosine reductase QueH, partial [Nitrospirota bacterium]|nr:epoxyqueuosine reductase QueH [Nitrospirota bacterium]
MPRNTDETGDACKGSLPRILVHICCAPCSIAPIRALLSRRAKLTGYFRNPNIHPRSEFERRLSSVKRLAELLDLEVVCDE